MSSEMELVAILDQYAILEVRLNDLVNDKLIEQEKVLDQVRGELAILDLSYDDDIYKLRAQVDALADEAKRRVIEIGHTVQNDEWQDQFVKGRESWDGKGLNGYAVAHPEINAFKTIGQPTARLVRRK